MTDSLPLGDQQVDGDLRELLKKKCKSCGTRWAWYDTPNDCPKCGLEMFAPGFDEIAYDPYGITYSFLPAIVTEMARQLTKFGLQDHPNGTGGPIARETCDRARALTDARAKNGLISWRDISDEEHTEALAEAGFEELETELLQDIAVKLSWLGAIQRRKNGLAVVEPRVYR